MKRTMKKGFDFLAEVTDYAEKWHKEILSVIKIDTSDLTEAERQITYKYLATFEYEVEE